MKVENSVDFSYHLVSFSFDIVREIRLHEDDWLDYKERFHSNEQLREEQEEKKRNCRLKH